MASRIFHAAVRRLLLQQQLLQLAAEILTRDPAEGVKRVEVVEPTLAEPKNYIAGDPTPLVDTDKKSRKRKGERKRTAWRVK